MKKRKTLDDEAHRAMQRPHREFVKSCGYGTESEFTNGYTWGFVAGYKAAMRKKTRTDQPTVVVE